MKDVPLKMSEESLKNRIYYAAKDGMAIALYTLLSDRSSAEINYLINEVCIYKNTQC